MWRRLLAAATAALALLSGTVRAHGLIESPVPRNKDSGTYCDHCLSGGGVGVVYARKQWPAGDYGMCGDPPSGEGAGYHLGGGKFEQTVGIRVTYYPAGASIKVRGRLTANHLGHFEYFLCKLPDSSKGGKGEARHLTDACFRKNRLKVFQDGKWDNRFYINGKTAEFQHSVKLPDVECKRCVLRWLYTTGNSCTVPGTPAKWAAGGLRTCGDDGANPEIFLNCADVALVPKGQTIPQPSKLKLRGELGSGEADDAGPQNQAIQDPDTGDVTSGGGGGGGGLSVGSIQFDEAALSLAIGSGLALPVVLISPVLGTAVGLMGFVVALVYFMIRQEGYCGARRA